MQMKTFEQALQKQIEELPKSVDPQRDLWAGIDIAIAESSVSKASEAKKEKENNKWFIQPGYSLAMVASVAFIAVLVWFGNNHRPQLEQIPAMNQLVVMLEQQHSQQKQALLTHYAGQEAVTDNWQEQLLELDKAAEAIKVALKNDPNNMALLKMLQQVHQQQISLIETVYQPKWQKI